MTKQKIEKFISLNDPHLVVNTTERECSRRNTTVRTIVVLSSHVFKVIESVNVLDSHVRIKSDRTVEPLEFYRINVGDFVARRSFENWRHFGRIQWHDNMALLLQSIWRWLDRTQVSYVWLSCDQCTCHNTLFELYQDTLGTWAFESFSWRTCWLEIEWGFSCCRGRHLYQWHRCWCFLWLQVLQLDFAVE